MCIVPDNHTIKCEVKEGSELEKMAGLFIFQSSMVTSLAPVSDHCLRVGKKLSGCFEFRATSLG